MGRLLVAVLGLGAVCAAVYMYLNQGFTTVSKERPAQALENVRVKAKDIESDAQKRAEEAFKNSEPAR
jgi:hypothetical protein